MDEFVVRHTPGPVVELHPAVHRARASLNSAMAALHAGVTDADMEFAWDWGGQEADVRYGFYRLFELLEVAVSEAERAVAGPDAWRQARAPMAAATASRWDLQGLLAGLTDADLDADPGGGEWTVRQTLGHILTSQRAYGWVTAWWLSRRDAETDDFPRRAPEELFEQMESEEAHAAGTLAEIRDRYDAILDAGAARLAMLEPADLDVRGRWSGLPVTIGFRQWRWSSHTREHTIQIDKTLVMLRRDPTEGDRLVRLIAGAYGRLEARVIGVAPEIVERAASGGRSAASIFADLAGTLDRYSASIPAAALARVVVTE